MAGSPTRAVRLIPVGEDVNADQLGQEQVSAYRAVQSAAKVSAIQVDILKRRNAALQASGRIYAYTNFR